MLRDGSVLLSIRVIFHDWRYTIMTKNIIKIRMSSIHSTALFNFIITVALGCET